jgi:regulatory protein
MTQSPSAKPRSAFELAVRHLSRRERTVAEVREALARRGVEAAEAEEAIDSLIEMGQLDDERYARLFSQDKRELHGWGPDRIREALVEKGIARDLAEAATGGEAPGELAERAAELLAGRNDRLEDDKGRGRALAFLARRGYELEVAYEAVRIAERRAA